MSDDPLIQVGPGRDDYETDILRGERDGAVGALRVLVALKDGPRDDHYRRAKDAAWENARNVLNEVRDA